MTWGYPLKTQPPEMKHLSPCVTVMICHSCLMSKNPRKNAPKIKPACTTHIKPTIWHEFHEAFKRKTLGVHSSTGKAVWGAQKGEWNERDLLPGARSNMVNKEE